MDEPKFQPGDVVILDGKGYAPDYSNALAYIDKRGLMINGHWGVTELMSPRPFIQAGATEDNMTKIGHIPELLND